MRLIDADKLPVTNTIEAIHGKEVFVNPWVSALAIENAPTVNAIPIEWIYNWADFYKVLSVKRYDTIRLMLEEWEKEYGKD